MRHTRLRRCARLGVLLACMSIGALLSGCALFHHHHDDVGCRRPEFTGDTSSLPPLKAPAGLSSPDTSQEIKIPPLTAAEPTRARAAPCLDWPPPYVSEPPFPPARRSAVPAPGQ